MPINISFKVIVQFAKNFYFKIVTAQFILSEVLSECIRSKASVYSSKTDVNSNSVAVGTSDLRLANWFANIVSKTTSHSLYYRKSNQAQL